ncbi:MAG TPA: hypothetical protein VMW10_11825 [Alphaproteobacteria bacterium]|nr:hypothetical protein [Alphaproteobacteria bacterium]
MKKILMTAMLIGLSGTALVAAPIEKQLISIPENVPPKAKALIEKFQSLKGVSSNNPIKVALDKMSEQTKTLNGSLNSLLKEKGYLVGSPLAQLIQGYITQTNIDIAALREAVKPNEDSAEIIFNNNQDVIPGLITILNQSVPANAFPFKCFDYASSGEGRKVTGVIQYAPGSKTVLYFYPVPFSESVHYNFLSGQNAKYDVGLIGSGSEYNVSTTLPGRNVDGWLNPQNVIVCLGLPYPVR